MTTLARTASVAFASITQARRIVDFRNQLTQGVPEREWRACVGLHRSRCAGASPRMCGVDGQSGLCRGSGL